MPILEANLPAEQRIILANDASDIQKARRTMDVARNAGACFIKLGLEFATATSWREASELADEYGLDWVADAKLDDIPNTVASAVRNISSVVHPPVGITIHANSGLNALKAAQEVAGEKGILMLGVTHLTSIDDAETKYTYGFLRKTLVAKRVRNIIKAGVEGAVCAPVEVRTVLKKNTKSKELITMIPGTRSHGQATHDQRNVVTPEQAISDGADFLVIGRQVTEAANPDLAFSDVQIEIDSGISRRHSFRGAA